MLCVSALCAVVAAILTCGTAVIAAGGKYPAGPTEFIPKGDAPDCNAVLVWAHGLGDTHKGWAPTMRLLQARHPHICVVLPTAPVIPVTFGEGRKLNAWYDFDGTEIKNATKEGDAASMTAAAKYLQDIALRRAKQIGNENFRRIVIGGFSQGAVISLHAGMTTPGSRCAGVVAVGGYMGAPNAFAAKAIRGARKKRFHPGTPVLLMHGDDDDRVPPGRSVDAKAKLVKAGASAVDVALFKKMGHGMNDEMLTRLSDFLNEVLPVDGFDDVDEGDL